MRQPGRPVTLQLVQLVLLTAAIVAPATAFAQTKPKPLATPKPKSPVPAGPRWEISFQGGFELAGGTPKGDSHTPAAGATFVMADGATPTRAVASWYYGDGVALLNQVLSLRGSTARLSALDGLYGWPVTSESGAEVGASIARHLQGRIWFEASVGVGVGGISFDDAMRDRIEATRASFETAFNALAASAASIISASSVTSTAEFGAGDRRLMVTGVVQYRGSERVIRPVLLAGAGWSSAIGGAATLTLSGTYRFTTPSQAVIEETDTLRLRYKRSSSIVWIFGGGMMHDLSRSSAYRVELRVRASSTKLTAHLDAEPSRVTGAPGGVLVLNATNPGIQFSSSPGINPSLSLPRSGFEAFSGEGRAFQLVLSASYIRKF